MQMCNGCACPRFRVSLQSERKLSFAARVRYFKNRDRALEHLCNVDKGVRQVLWRLLADREVSLWEDIP